MPAGGESEAGALGEAEALGALAVGWADGEAYIVRETAGLGEREARALALTTLVEALGVPCEAERRGEPE